MQDLSQAMVELSCLTDDACGGVQRCCGHVGHVTLQTQVRRDCHSEQMDVVLCRDGARPELKRWTTAGQRGLTVS